VEIRVAQGLLDRRVSGHAPEPSGRTGGNRRAELRHATAPQFVEAVGDREPGLHPGLLAPRPASTGFAECGSSGQSAITSSFQLTVIFAKLSPRKAAAASNPHSRPTARRSPAGSFIGGFRTPAPYTRPIARAGPASETLPASGHTTTPTGAAQFDPGRSESAYRKVPKAGARGFRSLSNSTPRPGQEGGARRDRCSVSWMYVS
jgi:hypothetical protein